MNTLNICLIISFFTVVSYVWGKISMPLTAVISLAAFVLTGCLKPNDALANFGNANGIMIMSMFVVAAGLQKTKLIGTISGSVSRFAKGSVTKVMAGYIVISIILSQFIQSPMIVFGIMAPMILETCREMNIAPSKVMFPLGISAIATCSTLPLGSGATVAAELNGYLSANDYTTYVMNITDPMKARFPVLIVCALYCIFFAYKIAPNLEMQTLGTEQSREKKDKAYTLSDFQERAGYLIFFLTTLGLIFQQQISTFMIAPAWLICFIGAIAMVLTGVLNGKEAAQAMNIPMYLLFVGAMSMGSALSSSGAGTIIGNTIANITMQIGNPYLIGAIFFLVPFLLTQVMQNRAVMLIFIPIAIQACKSMGANPLGIINMVQAGCLTAFMTPMATPAVPMIMAEGNYNFMHMLKQSIIPAILFSVVTIIWTMTVFPLY